MPQSASSAPPVVRFGVFELDAASGELRKNGRKLRIEGQPLQILEFLVERPGQVVTREELRQRLWPSDTFVDFEHGINSAIKRLRQALDDSAETPRFIETLPRRGYRFIYPLNADLRSPGEATITARRGWVVVVPLLGLVCVTALLLAWLKVFSAPSRATSNAEVPAIRRLAVLPLENRTGNAGDEYLADGIQDDLITALNQIDEFEVIERRSVLRYRRSDRPASVIARELNVDGLVDAQLFRSGDRRRVSVTLIPAGSDTYLWTQSYERDLRALSLVSKEIALDVAEVVQVQLTREEHEALTAGKAVDPDVLTAYRQGKFLVDDWTNESVRQGIPHLKEAIRLDPTYAPAWAQMGAAYEWLATFARGKELSRTDALAEAKNCLQRAVGLDPMLRTPHQSLARILRGEGDVEGSAREFQRAREVDRKWLGPNVYLMATGRYDEALAASRQAAEVDPFNYSAQQIYGHELFLAGRYDESIAQLKKAVLLNPSAPATHSDLARNYVKKGMLKEAATECDTALGLRRKKQPNARFVVHCGWVYARAGRVAQALEMAAQLPVSDDALTAVETGMGDKGGFRELAKIYDALGDRERALTYLAQSDRRAVPPIPLQDDKMFSDEIRKDPRFQGLALKQARYPPPVGALAEVRTRRK